MDRVIVVIYVLSLGIEDLRDLDGDRRVHRTRLVNIIGQQATRAVCCTVQFAAPFVFHFTLFQHTNAPFLLVLICDGLVAFFAWGTVYRLLTQRNPRADHITYMFFTCGYTAACATGMLLL